MRIIGQFADNGQANLEEFKVFDHSVKVEAEQGELIDSSGKKWGAISADGRWVNFDLYKKRGIHAILWVVKS